jgi:hypothetical protein
MPTEQERLGFALTKARFYGDVGDYDVKALLDGCSREELVDLAVVLADWLARMVHSVRRPDGSPVDPDEQLRDLDRWLSGAFLEE